MDPAQDNWRDITDEFRESVTHLNLGELVKPDSFTLLEAMTAIQLMDPKMDSGMALRKVNREVLSAEQLFKTGKLKVAGLELDELIGIIDDTYACITTWLSGHPLALSVMTNVYLHDTEIIEDRCLKVFCQAILKIVEIVDRMIGVVYCIEEEDFFLNNGQFSLADKLNDQKVMNSLEDLCQQYEKMHIDMNKSACNNQRHSNNKGKSPKTTNRGNGIEEIDKENKTELELIAPIDKSMRPQLGALITRLRFTQNLYACFLHVSRNLLKDNIIAPGFVSQPQAQKIVKLVQTTANSCDQHLEACLNLLANWSETIDFGIKPPIEDGSVDPIYGDYPTIMGFEPLVNLKLLSPAFPTCRILQSRPDAVESLRHTIINLRKCIAISGLFHQSKSFIKSLQALENFSKYHRPKSCVISRSFLQTLYLSNRILPILKLEIIQSMTEYCEPFIELVKADEVKSKALDDLLEECYKLFLQIMTMYCHNPIRQHERYTDIINSFRNLQYSAYLLSDLYKNMMVYSWTTYYFMKFCIKYVLSGFELELHSPHEYPYIFWYLYEILLRNEREQLELAKKLVVATCEQTINNGGLNNDCKTVTKLTKTKVKKRLSKLDNMIEAFHDKNLLLNEAMSNLIHGLFLLTFGLKLQGIIKSPSEEFTSTKTCFEHRFGIITGGSSVYFSYEQAIDARPKDLKYNYQDASIHLRRATELFEKCEDQSECLAVSKANNVVALILYTNPKTFADRQVEFCFDKHPSLPIIKI